MKHSYLLKQQSACLAQLPNGNSCIQLSVPHIRFPVQSWSLSQSPPPTSHGLVEEQQSHCIEGIPLHEPDGSCVVDFVVCIVVCVGAIIWDVEF